MKKFKFYSIIIIFLISIIEIFSYFVVKLIKEKTFLANFNEDQYRPYLLKKYSEFIPYSRNSINYNELNNYIVKDENSYFYTVINNFDVKNKSNILIQGDSWAEIANKKEIFSNLKKISKEKQVGLINAGISSYSPSPMMSQLYILKKEFNIKPSIIIAIIDQTDIGDELYRYQTLKNNSFAPTLTKLHLEFYFESKKKLNQYNISLIKLLNYSYSYFNLNKNLYNLDNIDTFLFLSKRIKAKLFDIPIVLSPLKFGLTKNEKNIFKMRLENYINFAFINTNLDHLYIVTHPHLKHLTNEFKLNINNLVDETINENENHEKIQHIDFMKLNSKFDKEIYLKEDVFSHLNEVSYLNYYFPSIFSKIKP